MLIKRILYALLLSAISLAGVNLSGATPGDVTVTLDLKHVGRTIPADFTGLSYEISLVLPDRDGNYYFSAKNQPLIALFRTLGIKSLRVGGNTADRPGIPTPTTADADSLFAFAKAAGAKVIYTVRLDGGDPQADAAMVKYLVEHYPSNLECITIGNEPNKEFTNNFAAYHAAMSKILDAASRAAPGAKFCGPSAMHTVPEWAADMAAAYAHDPRIDFITQHYYCGKSGEHATNAGRAQDKILSPDMLTNYEYFCHQFMPAVISNGFTCRIEETSSYSRGGARGTSDTFASALWALDYLHWWAAQPGTRGFNFHMGNIYGAFVDARDGYSVRPLSYGIKAFELGGQGRVVPVRVGENVDDLNFTAYSVLQATNLYVTLINKEHGPDGRDAMVTIAPGMRFAHCEGMSLRAPDGNLSAKTNLTLGGSAISGNGRWDGHWTPLNYTEDDGTYRIKVPAATAIIVRFNPE